jgi:hypothetical protein
MRIPTKIGFGLAVALLGAACDSDRVAGGSVETENLSAIVLNADSVAPFAMRVGILPVVATVRLDSTNFDFERAGSSGQNLVAERLDGTPIPFAIRRWEAKDRWARIQVRIEGEMLRKGSRFRLRSTNDTVGKPDSIAVWARIPEVFREQWTSVLVDDFEQGVVRTRLPIGSPWYVKQADSATISDPVLVSAEGGRIGTAIRFDYNAPSALPGYVLMGTTLASHPVNFGSLDSIVFWAKGKGILSVSLDHQAPEGGVTKTWMHNTLDSNYTRWCVQPKDFDPAGPGGGNLGWDSVHDSVTTLSIFASGSGSVMLDDIRFFGMQADDFR